jgi:hypothetical protein
MRVGGKVAPEEGRGRRNWEQGSAAVPGIRNDFHPLENKLIL